MTSQLDIWSFLLIIGIGQGLMLIGILFFGKQSRLSQKVLGVLLLILTLNLVEWLFLNSRFYLQAPHLLRVTQPFLFLMGPAFYFFVRTYLDSEFKFKRIHWLHLVPLILAIAYHIPWFMRPGEFKLFAYTRAIEGIPSGVGWRGFLYALTHITVTLSYALIALKTIRNRQNEGARLANGSGEKLVFLFKFNRVFMTYWILQLTGLVGIMVAQYYVLKIDYVLSLMNSAFIQLLSYRFLSRPERLSGMVVSRKYQKSSLNLAEQKVLLSGIEKLMQQEEIYLDSALTLQKFSDKLEVNKNYVSQVINDEFNQGFTDYINSHRVKKAQAIMANPQQDWMKLLAVALESGFNNKTSFNRVFSKQTGKSPSDYRKELLALREN